MYLSRLQFHVRYSPSFLTVPVYSIDPDTGKRVYTVKKVTGTGEATVSAHPARFSPDDKMSQERVTLKRRFGLLPMQIEAAKAKAAGNV